MSKLIMTLEFGTSKVICAIGRKRMRGRFEIVSFSPVSYAGIKKGQWQSLDNVPAVLKKAVSEAKSASKRAADDVFIGIPACFTRVHCVTEQMELSDNQEISQDIIDEMMEKAADFEVPDEYVLVERNPVFFKLDDDNLFIDPLGMDASHIEGKFSFVFANKSFLHEVETMMELLNINVTAFKPELLSQALFLIPVEERDSSSVLLDVGYYDTSVSIAYGDTIIFTRTIPVGGAQIASDLAKVLDIDPDAAERVKRRFEFLGDAIPRHIKETVRQSDGTLKEIDKKLVDDIVTARVEHLCGLVNRALDISDVALPSSTNVYLTGAGVSMMKGAVGFISDCLIKNVIMPEIEAVSYSTPNYFNSIGLMDYILTNEVG